MPLREYACSSCGLVFEKLISGFTPPQQAPCQCGGKALLRFPVCSVITSGRGLASNPSVKGDVLVGHYAEKAWQEYDKLQKVKAPLRQQAKQEKTGLTIDTKEGCVRTMTHQELNARKTGLRLWAKTEQRK